MQKNAKIFLCFFSETPFKVTNFNTSPMPPPPPFESLSLDALNSEQKPSVKKGEDFEIYQSGRENPVRFHL